MNMATITVSPTRILGLNLGASAGFIRPLMVRTYLAGSEIYAQGSRAGELFVVEYGAVRIHRLLADGRRQVVAFHLAGETFGFEAGNTRTFFAEAITATGIRPLGAAADDPNAPDLMVLALKGMLKAQEHLLVIGRQCARERVAAFLLDMAERQGDDLRIELPMPRIDIADYLGLTIETVSRTFAKLREQGVIELRGTRIVTLKKREILTELCR